MIKSPLYWLLFALLLSRINANCQVADDFTIKHYTSKNGLPQNSIRTLLMDDDRFLWMTTEGGLVRFDGQAFKVYNHLNTPAIKNDRFISVLKTMNGDFVAFDQAQSTFKITNGKPVSVHPGNRKTPPEINFDGSVPDISYLINCFNKNYSGFNAAERRGNPLTIFPISDNRFAVLLKNSLRIFNNEKSEYELSFSDYNAASFFQISGIIYFYDSSNQIYYFDLVNKSIKLARLVNSPTSKEINILKYLGKTIWSYSNPGVFFRENSNLFQIYSKDNASELYIKLLNTKLPENCIISSVILDPKSESIFIGTFTKGLYVFRKNKFKTLVYANSTVDINNSYYSQCETESGVVLTHIKKEFSIDGGKISSIPFRQISNKIVYKDKNNIIWTTRLDSIFYYNRTTKTLNFICAKDRSEFYCIMEDGDSLIIAGSKGIGSISNYTYKLNTKIINSDPDSKIESIIRGPDENIWMASCLGVSIIEKKTGEVQLLVELKGICARTLFRQGSKVLIGTYGQGYYVWENGKAVALPVDHNNYLSHVHSFLIDKNNRLWMSTNKGLLNTKYENINKYINDSTFKFDYQVYGEDDGILNSEFNGGCSPSVLRLSTGYVSYPTMEGLVWLKPEEIPDEFPDEKIIIDEMIIDGISTDSLNKVFVSNKHESVKFTFSTPYWGNSINLNMEYLMDGFNKDWMPLSANETSISFSNLPSGNYTFRLRKLNGIAANSYIEGSIAFSVEKKFYESGTFLLLIIAGLSSFILLLLKFNSQRIIKKNLDLEKSIDERTKELKKANLLLEENNSELAQKEQFLKDSILVKDRLISVISHDIITPLKFISMVSRISKKNPDMLDRNKLIDSMNDIEFASDKLYNNASNILNWMKFQNNRIKPKLDYIAIHDFVGEVSDPLIGMLDIKGLKIENNIPEEDIIITDRNILTIILQNILSNAIKYSNSGNITFTANHQNSNYLMSITDNGIGMSLATLANIDKIKSRKVHFSATDFNPDTSSNLGYYIIVDFLQLLGGSLDVKSVTGKGTRVTIAIPIPS